GRARDLEPHGPAPRLDREAKAQERAALPLQVDHPRDVSEQRGVPGKETEGEALLRLAALDHAPAHIGEESAPPLSKGRLVERAGDRKLCRHSSLYWGPFEPCMRQGPEPRALTPRLDGAPRRIRLGCLRP